MLVNFGIKNESLRKSLGDWTLAVGLVLYFFVIAERARPFNRQFSLSDHTIQHPFAISERVSGIQCLLLGFFVPLITIGVASLYLKQKYKRTHAEYINLLQISVLGLVLALSIDGVFTDILKNWIARPRPDFLARCGPRAGTPENKLVGIEVCTAPLGELILIDGMRSTPSGHSSISFACMLYLSLWIWGQFRVFQRNTPMYAFVLLCMPLLLAFYIALSRTQDYRHHFGDVFMGGIIGCAVGFGVYHKYFPWVGHSTPEKPFSDDSDVVLPL